MTGTRDRLRLLTWNIHAGIGADRRYNLTRIIDLVRNHAPDIIALQEVDSRGRADDLPLANLTKALGRYAAEARTIVAPDGHYGHVLLSHWPLRNVQLHDLSMPGHEARFAIEAGLDTPWGALTVIAAHLGLRLGESRRQVALLRDIVSRLTGPLVMAGDFNDWHGQMRRSFLPLLPARTSHRTFPARWPLLDLDGVYCRPQQALLNSWADRNGRHASDHLPVLAEIAFPESA